MSVQILALSSNQGNSSQTNVKWIPLMHRKKKKLSCISFSFRVTLNLGIVERILSLQGPSNKKKLQSSRQLRMLIIGRLSERQTAETPSLRSPRTIYNYCYKGMHHFPKRPTENMNLHFYCPLARVTSSELRHKEANKKICCHVFINVVTWITQPILSKYDIQSWRRRGGREGGLAYNQNQNMYCQAAFVLTCDSLVSSFKN